LVVGSTASQVNLVNGDASGQLLLRMGSQQRDVTLVDLRGAARAEKIGAADTPPVGTHGQTGNERYVDDKTGRAAFGLLGQKVRIAPEVAACGVGAFEPGRVAIRINAAAASGVAGPART